jgi:hypothetical protein
MHNVLNPPAGHVYYAWIELPGMEGQTPQHWQVSVQNSSISSSYTTPDHANLLPPKALFLITSESADQQPVVPFTDPAARLYYATITQPTTTFTIAPCPASDTSTVCLG